MYYERGSLRDGFGCPACRVMPLHPHPAVSDFVVTLDPIAMVTSDVSAVDGFRLRSHARATKAKRKEGEPEGDAGAARTRVAADKSFVWLYSPSNACVCLSFASLLADLLESTRVGSCMVAAVCGTGDARGGWVSGSMRADGLTNQTITQ